MSNNGHNFRLFCIMVISITARFYFALVDLFAFELGRLEILIVDHCLPGTCAPLAQCFPRESDAWTNLEVVFLLSTCLSVLLACRCFV
jgi:hypothetical protein